MTTERKTDFGPPHYSKFLPPVIKENFHEIWNNEKHRVFRKFQNSGAIALCNHCILGVQRNHSFLKSLKRNFFLSPNWSKYFQF